MQRRDAAVELVAHGRTARRVKMHRAELPRLASHGMLVLIALPGERDACDYDKHEEHDGAMLHNRPS
jgi:hypothetical protein